MEDKIKVCFVKFNVEKGKKMYLFEIPTNVYLDEGDTVIVPDISGIEREATVIDTDTFTSKYESDMEEFKRLLGVAGVELPLKRVIGKVRRTYFKYEDEVKDDENSTHED